MKLEFEKGSKSEDDKLIKATMQREAFSITKLSILINELALNELRLHKDTVARTGNFFFWDVIKDAVDLAKENISMRERLNDPVFLVEYCKHYFLNKTKVKKEIDYEIQLVLK